EKKKKRGDKRPNTRVRSSPVRRRRLRIVVAHGSWALFLSRGEKDRGDPTAQTLSYTTVYAVSSTERETLCGRERLMALLIFPNKNPTRGVGPAPVRCVDS
ncbi:hypothetical protein GW17_00031498, partial [Ensete ventricosum]